MVKEIYPEVEGVTIFGEMFGGIYPHPDVANDRKIMNIQKGVFYCPQHEFYAFDLYIRIAEKGRFLDADEANALYERGGFFYAKTLFRGTLEQCLQYPNDAMTLIPEWLGFPPIEDNVCEGVVIRPVKPSYLSNGARVLLKNKNARFAEKKARKRADRPFVPPTQSELLTELLEIVEQYVTENRLNNVMSKIGQISLPKEVGMLMGMFSKDIIEDFLKEHSGQYAMLEKIEQKIFNRNVNTMAVNLIKQVYFHQ
jgi:Rnl2 family RNA ligase